MTHQNSNSKHNNNQKFVATPEAPQQKKKKKRFGHLKYVHQFPFEHCCKQFIIALRMLVTGCLLIIR
jgi:hypothetical protein